MNYKYSIEEILSAIDDLNNINKIKNKKIINKAIDVKSDIPSNTLKLIEEAESNN
tara:strand:+ start:319 stop:483 length:165 start_codon:yes stop_codon:yes gene_type:complete